VKRWRYSVGLKAAAAAAIQILSVIFVLCLMILIMLFQKDVFHFEERRGTPYESSNYFTNQLKEAAQEILEFCELRRDFETNQVFDPNKPVDIWQYYERQEISQVKKNKKNAVIYNLGDLAEWSRAYTTSVYEFVSEYEVDNGISQRRIIYKNGENVFSEEKSISGFMDMAPELRDRIIENVEYYYGGSYSTTGDMGISQEYFHSGETDTAEVVVAETKEESFTDEELQGVIQKVLNGQLYGLDAKELEWLLISMDNMRFFNHSVAYDFIDEEYLPKNGVGIWENFMGGTVSLEDMQNSYRALNYTLEQIGQKVRQYRECLNTYHNATTGSNLSYWISRDMESAAYTNMKDSKTSALAEYGKNLGKYLLYRENDIHFETNINGMEEYFYQHIEPVYGNKGSVLFLGFDTSVPFPDKFQEAKQEYQKMHPWVQICMWGAGLSFLTILIVFIYLSIVAGKKDDSGKVHLNLFDRIPTEFLLLLFVVEIIVSVWAGGKVLYQYESNYQTLMMIGGGITFVATAFLMVFYLSFVRRIRAGGLWSGSMIGWFFRGIGLLFTSRKSLTKMVIWFVLHLMACVILLPMIATCYNDDIHVLGVVMFSILCGVEGVLIIREGVQRNKVLDGIGKIASGDLEYKIAEEELKGDNCRLAQAVNTIGEGLYHAVDASMKNERLQADLITNVSHDIKTPLTSIINYVDLLKREKLDNERAQGYIAVLESKSQRLKQLAEDLVEASRISSGNIKLEMERINLVELVHQTEGEFAERFEERSLQVMSNLPRESVIILADGRRIWRVLENLYNNVAKYAMEHTRVYVDMEADGSQVLFSIKNISENPLNIPAEELTERFIRGDISRSTEGSGLGLSIAKNLMTMMGGTFDIYLDGDLFKVMIRFRQEQPNQENQEKTE
jgi:signal transduction histidine kinase